MPERQKSRLIRFNYLVPVTFLHRRLCKALIIKILANEKYVIESINFIFCSDPYLLKINQHHLKHDFYTDIITFDLSHQEGSVIADIYISVDRVRENASSIGVSFQEELRRVIFHGALHLVGFRDKSMPDKKRMRAAEDRYLSLFRRQLRR